MDLKKKSWKTTMCGVLGALGIVVMNLTAVLDDDPKTVVDPVKVVESLSLLAVAVGLVAARDDDKTSEDRGLVK